MSNNQPVTVVFTAENWKSITDIIKYSCQIKGDDWIKWGQNINYIVQSSIDKNVVENPVNRKIASDKSNDGPDDEFYDWLAEQHGY